MSFLFLIPPPLYPPVSWGEAQQHAATAHFLLEVPVPQTCEYEVEAKQHFNTPQEQVASTNDRMHSPNRIKKVGQPNKETKTHQES